MAALQQKGASSEEIQDAELALEQALDGMLDEHQDIDEFDNFDFGEDSDEQESKKKKQKTEAKKVDQPRVYNSFLAQFLQEIRASIIF